MIGEFGITVMVYGIMLMWAVVGVRFIVRGIYHLMNR